MLCLYYSFSSKQISPRARPCVFESYPSGYKGYKVLDFESHAVSVSRNVVFHEHVFPFKTSELLSKTVDMFPNSILLLPIPLHFVETTPFYENTASDFDADVTAHTDSSASSSSSSPSTIDILPTVTPDTSPLYVPVAKPK